MWYSTPFKSDELYHHGIKGMKWGVRRYENKDGSLTEAGKKKYKSQENHVKSKTRRKKIRNALGILAAVAATTYGGKKLYDNLQVSKANEYFKDREKRMYEKKQREAMLSANRKRYDRWEDRLLKAYDHMSDSLYNNRSKYSNYEEFDKKNKEIRDKYERIRKKIINTRRKYRD